MSIRRPHRRFGFRGIGDNSTVPTPPPASTERVTELAVIRITEDGIARVTEP